MISLAPARVEVYRSVPTNNAVVPVPEERPAIMAEQLARVFGTEEDPVNCAFYFKVGVCRHGDMCSKKHTRPTSSRTLLLTNMYPNPWEALAIGNEEPWDDAMYDRAQAHVESFYEEVVLVLAEYGEIEEVVVVDNTIEYQCGNVYVKYYHENAAERALKGLTGRYYFNKLISAEYSPVTDFREARCRTFHETRCSRGGACRFLHIKHIPTAWKRRVAREMYEEHPEYLARASSSYPSERERSRRRVRERDKSRRRRAALRDREPVPALMDDAQQGSGSKQAGGNDGGRGRRGGSRSPAGERRKDSRDRGDDRGADRGGDRGSDRLAEPRSSNRQRDRNRHRSPLPGEIGGNRRDRSSGRIPEDDGGGGSGGTREARKGPTRGDSREPCERGRGGGGGGRRSMVSE